MSRFQEIQRQIRLSKAEIYSFVQRHGARPFYGDDRTRKGGHIAVTRELNPAKLGWWRVTWFVDGEPHGHSEFRSFREAVRSAVREYGLDLSTVKHG